MNIAGVKIPTIQNLVMLAVALVILMAILRFTPENIKKWFRV